MGADNHERRARKRTGWKAHIESKTQSADLPSSWRSTSTKTHSLPRTLVFRGFTSHQLGSRSLTLGPPVDTALLRAMATSELPRQGANLSANQFTSHQASDFSIAKTKVSRHSVFLIQCEPSSQFVFELVSRDCQPPLPLLLSLSFYLNNWHVKG